MDMQENQNINQNETDNCDSNKSENNEEVNLDLTRSFLSDAISNLASCIQLIDTKVSIIMATITAMIAILLSDGVDSLSNTYSKISTIRWAPNLFWGLLIVMFIGMVGVIFSGVLAIRIHSPQMREDTEWYFSLKKPINRKGLGKSIHDGRLSNIVRDIDEYKKHVLCMTDHTIITSMATELWKLNTLNEKKVKMYKSQLICFVISIIACILVSVFCIIIEHCIPVTP